jgi:Methylamine utilisation protein MauE
VRTAVLIDPGGWDDSGLGRAPAPQPSNSATRVARQSAEANGRPRRTSTRLATVVIFYLLACLDPSDPGSVAGIAALVLLAPVVGVLVGAAGSKLRDQVGFRRTLDEQGWPSALVPATAVSVPLVEGGLVLLLIVPDTELFGAIAAAAVFGAFAAFQTWLRVKRPGTPCGCFGNAEPATWRGVALDTLLMALGCGLGLILLLGGTGGNSSRGIVANVVAAGLGIPLVKGVVVFNDIRQHRLELERGS